MAAFIAYTNAIRANLLGLSIHLIFNIYVVFFSTFEIYRLWKALSIIFRLFLHSIAD